MLALNVVLAIELAHRYRIHLAEAVAGRKRDVACLPKQRRHTDSLVEIRRTGKSDVDLAAKQRAFQLFAIGFPHMQFELRRLIPQGREVAGQHASADRREYT